MDIKIYWSEYPDMSDARKWDFVEMECDKLLAQCDWTQIPDSGLTFAQQTAWLDYRQALREIREIYVNPDDVIIPDIPEGTI